ncbi:uncharacterized protein LOC129373834 isoform X2 [Poeciliopsis prolifica]|uniref:uncharacterized protein LOC129373834 isoform X2 n=1 Tax=Poeciliopsis prolifica TaxID=188132 RepID=UPI0024134BF6|nr:uncharacterized protein LOC129373834 isoform X2 [Poeciliopsis prolifica]
MDVSWLSLLMMAAAFAASVLLAAVCLDCGNRSPLASISQTAASEEYVASGFVVVHPYAGQARLDQNLVHSPSTLKPHSIPAGRGSDQTRPYTPTETESNPSYENRAPEMDFPDSDTEGNGYIEVLPETEPSRASTPSLDGADYVNLEDENKRQEQEPEPDQDSDSDSESDHNYENVKSESPVASTPDEDENYVNV